MVLKPKRANISAGAKTSQRTAILQKSLSNSLINIIQYSSGQIKYLTMTDPDKVWMPDTFFQNEKTGHFHNIIVPNVYVRIFPDGEVLYSIRSVMSVNWMSSMVCPEGTKLPEIVQSSKTDPKQTQSRPKCKKCYIL